MTRPRIRKSGGHGPPPGQHWIAIEWQAPGGPKQYYCRAWQSIGLAVVEGPPLIAMIAKGPFAILDIRESPVGPDAWEYLNKRLRAEHAAKIAGTGVDHNLKPASIRLWWERFFKRRE